MVRTVRVRLELDRTDFKQGLRDAANDTRTFDGEVQSLGKSATRTGIELKDTDSAAKKLGDDVKQSSKDVDAMGSSVKAVGRAAVPTGDQVRKLSDSVRTTGDESGKTSTRLAALAHDIKDTEETVRLLSHAWVQTRDADIGPMLRDQQAALRSLRTEYDRLTAESPKGPGLLSRLFSMATPSISNSEIKAMKDTGLQAGEAFSGGFLSSAVKVLGAASPVLVPALFALVSGAAAAAGLGTVGAGAIATGLVLQLSDPRVKAAATDLGSYLKAQLKDLTSGFAGQFVSGFEALKREAAPLFTDLRSGFQSLDPYVSELLMRLGEGLAKLGPGLNRALQAAGPILAVLANNIPTLLNGVNIFFDEISKGGKGAAEALDAMIKGISGFIAGLGFALRIGADMYDVLVQGADKFWSIMSKAVDVLAPFSAAAAAAAGPIHSLADYTHGVATSFDQAQLSADGASTAFDGAGAAAVTSAAQINSSRQSVLDWQSGALAADQAADSWRQGLLNMADQVKQHGASLKENTTAGEANISMLHGMVDTAKAARDAQIAHGVSVAFADQQYQDQIATLENNAIHLGMNRDDVHKLLDVYKQVPGDVTTHVVTPGMVEAIQNGQTLASLLHGINGSVARATIISTYYTVQGTTPGGLRGPVVAKRYGGVMAYASGGVDYKARSGILRPSDPGTILAGEPQTGGEVFGPRLGISHERGLGLANVLASWHGGRVVANGQLAGGVAYATTVNLTVNAGIGTDGAAVGRQIADQLKPYIRSSGGGNVQAALGVRGS